MGIKLGNVMAVSKTTLCCGNSWWWLLLSMFNKEVVIQCQFYGRDVHSTAPDDRLSASCFLMMVLHLLHLLNSFAACIDSPAQSISAELGWRTTLKIFTKRGRVFQQIYGNEASEVPKWCFAVAIHHDQCIILLGVKLEISAKDIRLLVLWIHREHSTSQSEVHGWEWVSLNLLSCGSILHIQSLVIIFISSIPCSPPPLCFLHN